jgi:hypothetical protein
MKRLIEDLMHSFRISHTDAKITADRLVTLVTKRVQDGESIRMGPVTIQATPRKAQMVKSYLPRVVKSQNPKGTDATFYLADTIKWSVEVLESWQKEAKPRWSKHSY